MKRARTLLAALALGAAPLLAEATTAPTLPLTQQARKATVIVRATLGTPTRVTEEGVTWVVSPLTVSEVVAGDPATLPQREGQPALYVLAGLEGVPELRAGQEGFFLLYAGRMDSPFVGFSQGFYPIVNGKVTRPGPAAETAATSSTATTPETTTPTAPAATGTTTTGTAGTPPPATLPADPNAFPTDPAAFRDALRAARGGQ